jgi:hypothetical protein
LVDGLLRRADFGRRSELWYVTITNISFCERALEVLAINKGKLRAADASSPSNITEDLNVGVL